jgi:putative FmdB family regulatory protein
MARISDKVKGSGCCAQLTGQFAVEEMISVTRACRSTGVGRGMVFPLVIVDLRRTYKYRRAAGIPCAIDGYEGVLCAKHRRVNRIASTNVCGCNSANSARTEEGTVPHYEYLCSACNKKFSIVLTLAEHEKGQVKCPKCGSTKVEQQWAAFYATTSKKS